MASIYIDQWLKDVQSKIDFWFDNFPINPGAFSITSLPGAPVIDPRILSHNVTSTCPSPNYPSISFEHFPEPYYGDPDDDVEKLAVVLFYNPGPSGSGQLLSARGSGTFYGNYIKSGSDYYTLSKNLNFCLGTINGFWHPKNDQLLNLFEQCYFNKDSKKPLFMDLVPWHSDSYKGLNSRRYRLPETLKEVKENVILPAVLNANNSSISIYLNRIHGSDNKIVLFAVGSLYSRQNYLLRLGFEDVTMSIHEMLPHTRRHNSDIRIGDTTSVMKIWKIISNELISGDSDIDAIKDKEVYIVNLWTSNIGMNLPRNASPTLEHIFRNL